VGFDRLKNFVKKTAKAISQVRGKGGKQLTTVEEQVLRWQEHFGEILSAPAHEHEHDINTTQHPLAKNENPPSTQK